MHIKNDRIHICERRNKKKQTHISKKNDPETVIFPPEDAFENIS